MGLQGCALLQRPAATQDSIHAAADLANSDEYGSLILDHTGCILSCGVAAEKVFGASDGRLIGRRFSELVSGLLLDGNSPSYSARYLVYLCADGEWKKFEGTELGGQSFDVELNLSRMLTEGREVFLVNLRRRSLDMH